MKFVKKNMVHSEISSAEVKRAISSLSLQTCLELTKQPS